MLPGQAFTVWSCAGEGYPCMADVTFERQLHLILDRAPATLRDQFQWTIDQVTRAGIGSFGELLAIVQDETADPELRVAVCWLLGQWGNKRAAYALLRAFGSAQDQLRQQAAHALGVLGSKAAVRPLLHALQAEHSAERRADAAYALGHLGDARAVEPLLRVLKDRQEAARVRGQAAESLAYLPDRTPAVRAALTDALADTQVEVRFWAAFALGQIADSDDHAAIQALERLAATDTATLPGWWTVRQEATAALEHIKQMADGARDQHG